MIVQSIVDLVRALDIDSVAEGVESAEVATALRVMGCKAAQGWHFSKPLSAAPATAWLIEHGVAAEFPAPLPPAHSAVGPPPTAPAPFTAPPPFTGQPNGSVPAPGLQPGHPVTPPTSVPAPGAASLWWQAVNGFGPRLQGR